MKLARVSHQGRDLLAEIDGDFAYPLSGDFYSNPSRVGDSFPLSEVICHSPTSGSRLFAQLGGFVGPGKPRLPDDIPRLCPKFAAAFIGDGDKVIWPAFVDTLQIEPEMAVVVGQLLHGASPEEAEQSILGYTCVNDVTAPQFGKPDWFLAKSLDTFSSIGPWIETSLTHHDVADGLEISVRINGTVAQSGNTKNYKFSPAEVLSYLSRFMTLNPGDVISMGTPPPPPEAKVGDVVEVIVERVGTLTNHIVADG
jgi:2-keto-4-pentenoate hydratase/2-oxohepta-3-ene-1,7-dioic acid hydratase in catechol pathway